MLDLDRGLVNSHHWYAYLSMSVHSFSNHLTLALTCGKTFLLRLWRVMRDHMSCDVSFEKQNWWYHTTEYSVITIAECVIRCYNLMIVLYQNRFIWLPCTFVDYYRSIYSCHAWLFVRTVWMWRVNVSYFERSLVHDEVHMLPM